MENKEIIIDGVDVAGCKYFNRFRSIWHNKNLCCDCEKNQDCYYKQLQREKQNSQEARDVAIKEFNRAEELKTLLKRKEQEYEELRQYHNKCCEENAKKLEEWLEKYNQVSTNFYNGDYCNTEHCSLLKAKEQECEKLKEEIKHYKQIAQYHGNLSVKYTNKSAKFKQCLTEIKEIAEICKCHNADGCYECKYFDDCEVEDEETPTRDVCKLILQKISECEVENEN